MRKSERKSLVRIVDSKSKWEKLAFLFGYMLRDAGTDLTHLFGGTKEEAERALTAYLKRERT